MKAIKNIKDLASILSSQVDNWQEIIFSRTNVILLLNDNGPLLFSNCGYIDLDADVEYLWVNGEDKTEYCNMSSINDMVDYILDMPSYKTILCDISYGNFCKSELFWSVYSRIIFAQQNLLLSDPPGNIIYRLYSINEFQNQIDLNMAVIACDVLNCYIPKVSNLTLNKALDLIVEQLNETAIEIGEPIYETHTENEIMVPRSYTELLGKLESNAEFGWLL